LCLHKMKRMSCTPMDRSGALEGDFCMGDLEF